MRQSRIFMHLFINIIFAVGLVFISMDSSIAERLTEEEECAIKKAEAAASYLQCLSRVQIEGMKQRLSSDEVTQLSMKCEAGMIDKTEALAMGRQCTITGDAAEVQAWSMLSNSKKKTAGEKPPQIPKQDFEWNGTFVANGAKLSDPQIMTDLTISGKWQKNKEDEWFFNLYMEQGSEDEDSPVWVENLVFEDSLYTITHRWHLEIPWYLKLCVVSPNISVDDLNGILLSSRHVGLEKIGGTPMNHFRTSCLTGPRAEPTPAPPTTKFPVSIFSDIYVRPGRSYPWERWLQFGDGVGLDTQHDEWFLFDEWNHNPKDIELPLLCHVPIPVEQIPCQNLIEKPEAD